MDLSTIIIAFGLTLFAGLSTGIGGAIAFFAKRTNVKFLSVALGFSAGVMIYISFTEMFTEANRFLIDYLGEKNGAWVAFLSFFGGMFLIALIDRLVPSFENPHEIHKVEEMRDKNLKIKYSRLFRMGVFATLAIAIHNFPEGLITFLGTVNDVKLGILLAFAIAIHNIPEGIAVSIPIYYATGKKRKAFFYSFVSGLMEPLGAVLGYTFLLFFMSELVLGVLFAMIAGIMVFISLDQLLPAAREYGEHHLSIYGLVSGMIVMALSLLLCF